MQESVKSLGTVVVRTSCMRATHIARKETQSGSRRDNYPRSDGQSHMQDNARNQGGHIRDQYPISQTSNGQFSNQRVSNYFQGRTNNLSQRNSRNWNSSYNNGNFGNNQQHKNQNRVTFDPNMQLGRQNNWRTSSPPPRGNWHTQSTQSAQNRNNNRSANACATHDPQTTDTTSPIHSDRVSTVNDDMMLKVSLFAEYTPCMTRDHS